MVTILWARHGENVANLTRTFSYRVFDGNLTDAGQEPALPGGSPAARRPPRGRCLTGSRAQSAGHQDHHQRIRSTPGRSAGPVCPDFVGPGP
jgi:hypothetical protein